MKLEQMLDNIHSKVTNNSFLQLFTSFTRILLAIGFIPPSIPKIMYQRFTLIPETHPVGHYFEALYQTGFYYQFIGWGQIIAAVLLLIPRTSHIGALMFFPIIINITVLTNSVGFKGTWLLTIFMSLASLYLVCWDYDRWKSTLFGRRSNKSNFFSYELIWLPLLFAIGGIAAYITLGFFIFQAILIIKPMFVVVLGIISFIFGLAVALHHKFMRIGDLEKSSLDIS